MQFFAVSVFSWSLFQAINMYMLFVNVWSEQPSVWKGCLVGWGSPLVIVTITIAVHFGLLNSIEDATDYDRMYPVFRETVM